MNNTKGNGMTNPATRDDTWLQANAELRMDANSPSFSLRSRAIHTLRYEFAKHYCEDKIALDGACGTGYGTSILGTKARSVVGIDLAQDAIGYARSHFESGAVTFEPSLVECTRFEAQSFDVVVSFETVEHTLCPRAHMAEIARVLRPDGTAILSVPNAWGLTDHHFFDFDYDLLKEVLAPVFGTIEYWVQRAADQSGSGGEIIPLTAESLPGSYCILAICRQPLPISTAPDVYRIMAEVYTSAFARHHEFRTLAYRANTNFLVRVAHWIKNKL